MGTTREVEEVEDTYSECKNFLEKGGDKDGRSKGYNGMGGVR